MMYSNRSLSRTNTLLKVIGVIELLLDFLNNYARNSKNNQLFRDIGFSMICLIQQNNPCRILKHAQRQRVNPCFWSTRRKLHSKHFTFNGREGIHVVYVIMPKPETDTHSNFHICMSICTKKCTSFALLKGGWEKGGKRKTKGLWRMGDKYKVIWIWIQNFLITFQPKQSNNIHTYSYICL